MRRAAQRTRGAWASSYARARASIYASVAIGLTWVVPAAAFAAPESIHVLVMIVDFADILAPPELRHKDGATWATVPLDPLNSEMVFETGASSTAVRYDEMSNAYLSVTTEVIEVSIPLMLGASTSLQWRAAADAEAVALGYTLSNYDRFGYLLSTGFSGQSGTGGAQGDWFWATGLAFCWVHENTFNHELGHTVALAHANEIQTNGSITTSGDTTDFMGSGNNVHTNAVHKDRKGWLGGSRKQGHALDTSNSYVLRALADPMDALQVVTVDSHGAHADIGHPVDTYLSFRTPTGFDTNLTTSNDPYGKPLRDTVHVHYGRKDGLSDTYLDRALEAGDIYVTQNATIEVLSIGATTASVSVDQTSYNPAAPTVDVTPVGADQALAGVTLDYTVSVTNNDAGVAFPAFYEQTFTPPAGGGWIVAWDSTPKNLLVDPGATEVFSTLRVISPVGAAPGIYDIDLELTNDTGSSGPVSTIASFTYEVLMNPDVTPPPPPTGLFGNTFPGTGDDYVVLQWTPPPDVTDVASYRPYRNGQALPVVTIPLAVDFGYSALVTNAYVVRSVDAANNESTPSNTAVFGAPDVEAPTAASNVSGNLGGGPPLELVLTWDPGTDNTWVEHYEIHRDGMLYDTTWDTTYTDTAPLAWATYTVYAVDASGNRSPASATWQLAAEIPSLGWLGLAALAVALVVGAGRMLRRQRATG